MRTSVVFMVGSCWVLAIAPGSAQDQKLPGDNYVNHVGFAVDNFEEAFAFYTQKMGFREAFTVKDAAGNRARLRAGEPQYVRGDPAGQREPPAGPEPLRPARAGPQGVVAALKQRGVMVDDVRVRPDDSSVANATDPNGIRIEMFEFGPGSPQGKAIASWK